MKTAATASSWEEDCFRLMRAGLPYGAVRPASRLAIDDDALCSATQRLVTSPNLPMPLREALIAWLSAWQHHWPNRFVQTFGEQGSSWLQLLRRVPVDANRYLKLRRIAIENLAR